MDEYRIAVIPGDGIGPEVTAAATAVVDAALEGTGARCRWHSLSWGSEHHLAHGRMMPPDGLDQLRGFDAILLGAVGDPRLPDHVTLHGLLLPIRRTFDQYLCLRPVRLFPGVESPLRAAAPVDLLIVRENTEGEYSDVGGREHEGTPEERVLQTGVFTRRGTTRIVEAAFQLAAARRRRLTSVTKSNAQRFSMVFWDEIVREVAPRYPDVVVDSILVDAAAMELVRRPERFDVLVASNLFGDILSDLAAAVTGSLGLAPSANIDPSRTWPSMFEPVHGSAPDIAGQGIANPVAAVLAAAMMLEHLGHAGPARRIETAVALVLSQGRRRTPDLGGTATTTDVQQAICQAI